MAPLVASPDTDEAPERLRRAEAVLGYRTGTQVLIRMCEEGSHRVGCCYLHMIGRLILVLEQCMDSHNHQAVLRTAEGTFSLS